MRQRFECLAQRCAALLLVVVLCLVTGCQSGRKSVKPGINDHYKNADVEKWVGRFESESREIAKHRAAIVDDVGLTPGLVVADIGAGTGLFVEPFSRRIGESGKLYAVDITPEFIEHIRNRADEAGLTNVETVLCKEDSVDLPPNSIDVVFVCDTYHHFEYPDASLASIHSALKPGGRLVVIDFDRIPGKSRDWILNHIRAGSDEVTAEIIRAGFTLAPNQPPAAYLDENYMLHFIKE